MSLSTAPTATDRSRARNRVQGRAGRPLDAARRTWSGALLLFFGCLAFYMLNLDRMPHPDELHHVLAARSLLETGEPRIAEGLYTRGLAYSWMVAASFWAFGEGLAQARLPSVLCMALLVPLVFLWLRSQAGPLAAWTGALLLATSPFAVEIAQFSRFYAPQTLLFFVGAVLVHAGFAPLRESGRAPFDPGRRGLLLAAGAVALLGAIYFQQTSLFGVLGIGVWVGCIVLPWLFGSGEPFVAITPRIRRLAAAALPPLAVAVFVLAWWLGFIDHIVELYRWAPVFNQSRADEFWFYFVSYFLFYPTLWTLSGLLVLAAAGRWPRPTWFALSVFVVSFLLNSFAAAKATRYLAYAQPFLFVLWGMGLAATVPFVARLLAELRDGLTQSVKGPSILVRRRLAGGLLATALLIVLLANPFWLRSASMMADIAIPPEKPTTNWPAARAALTPWLEEAEIVVTTEELGTLYFLGRYDIRYSPSKLGELEQATGQPVAVDPRTGRPVIAGLEEMEVVLDCFASGLLLGPIESWGAPELIDRDLVALLERRTRAVELPERSHMFARVWRHPPRSGGDPACAPLENLLAGRSP